jgi:hypothetical protein
MGLFGFEIRFDQLDAKYQEIATGKAPAKPEPAVSSRAPSSTEATALGQKYFAALFGGITGQKTEQAMFDLFTPDCQAQTRVYGVAAQLRTLRTIMIGLRGKKIEDVEFSKPAEVQARQGTYSATIPAAIDIKFKVDGEWVNAADFLRKNGLTPGAASQMQMSVVGERALVSDCGKLTKFAS